LFWEFEDEVGRGFAARGTFLPTSSLWEVDVDIRGLILGAGGLCLVLRVGLMGMRCSEPPLTGEIFLGLEIFEEGL
jgi:hypothetical protein